MPSFPQNNADCSVEWKSNPMQRLRKRLLAKIFKETQIEACTLVGTRFDESQARGQKMRARGDSATVPVRNKAGDLVLSPLAHWSSDDIWEALAMVRGKIMASYTDTEALFEIYQDAGPTSCAVVNDSILEGGASSRGGCGARTGCWCCLQVKTDASMENFLRKPEYEFMRGLNDLREFMSATQFDLSRRQWVGRTIEHGYIAIRPDAYSPAMMRELFRYVLTIQARENAESQRLGIPPRFQIVTEAGVVGVDAMWSLNGFHKAFAAIEDYYDVFIRGVRYDVPKIDPFPQVAMPEPRFLYVGDHWDADLGGQHPWTGMRDPLAESMTEVSGCIGTRELGDGRVVLEVNTEESFSVDEESACLTLDFELDHILGMRDQMMRIGGYTQSYKWWLMHGTISLAKGQVGRHDQVLRRTEFKARHGLCGADYDLNHVLAKSVSWQDVPQEVQEAFIAPAKLEAMKETARLEAERNRQHLLFA